MRGVDVNVLVLAHRADADRHAAFRIWLEEARSGEEALGVSDLVLSSFLRIVTHPKIFREPTPLDIALRFVDLVKSAPAATPLVPGARHWAVFTRLCEQTQARGNQIPEAWLAAMAIETGATWMTADRGFSRFPGLRWAHPLGP